ncbi:MAG TPA: OsmC family protein [Candidatus Binatia bacterium]|nr:OsmC family protein [Candidatus Binatia bacterium]
MKHTYTASVSWSRNGAPFTDGKYSRVHEWRFDGGAVVQASSSPLVVPVPHSSAAAVDPEEAYVASLASCHFLWFLHVARAAGYVVDRYDDAASGVMEKNAQGKLWVARVVLKPRVTFAGERQPSAAELAQMHHKAHDECFIANSVKSEVRVEPAG